MMKKMMKKRLLTFREEQYWGSVLCGEDDGTYNKLIEPKNLPIFEAYTRYIIQREKGDFAKRINDGRILLIEDLEQRAEAFKKIYKELERKNLRPFQRYLVDLSYSLSIEPYWHNAKKFRYIRESDRVLEQFLENENTRKDLENKLKSIRDSSQEARNTFIERNLRLVFKIATKLSRPGHLIEDTIQEGNVGLCKAAKRFDYIKGNRFSTYATYWIRQAINRSYINQHIKIPAKKDEEKNRMLMFKHYFNTRKMEGKIPNEVSFLEYFTEFLATTEVPEEELSMLLNLPLDISFKNLHGTMDNERDSRMLIEYIKNENSKRPDRDIENTCLKEMVERAISSLNIKQEAILRLRYGVGEARQYSLEEIGDRFRISRERVRQIEVIALKKLASYNRRLKFFQGL